MNESPANSSLPVVYAAALTGFVATIFPMAFLAIYGVASVGHSYGWYGAAFLFNLACFPAVVIMVLAGVPLHDLIQRIGWTSRRMYIGVTSVIIIGCYLLVVFPLVGTDVGLAALVPLAALPSGLFFHFVTQRVRDVPALDRRDRLIVGTLIAGCIAGWAQLGTSWSAFRFDPWHERYEVAALAFRLGLPAFVLSGVAAGIARLWSLRVGVGFVMLAWSIPALFIVAFFLKPLGPDRVHFSIGDQDLWIDWQLKPYRLQSAVESEVCFAPLNLFEGLHFTTNPNLCLSKSTDELVSGIATILDDNRSTEAGLQCEDALYSGRHGRICFGTDAAGHTTTLVECPPGYCSLRFDQGGLRYLLVLGPPDVAAWHELHDRAIKAVAEITGMSSPK